MQIFGLSESPRQAAQWSMDCHVVKMLEALENYREVYAAKHPQAYAHNGGRLDVAFLAYLIGKYARSCLARQTVIQYNEHNVELTHLLKYVRHSPALGGLVDGSLGTGKSPEQWKPVPMENRFWSHGFAGGLGPHNIEAELLKIAEVAQNIYGRPYWIDMESGLRTKDQFDFEKANTVSVVVAHLSSKWVRAEAA